MTGSDLPLVSVVIPLYNRERLIVDTLESVLSQTYPHIELIVADDCSSDRSLNVVRSVMPRFSAKAQVLESSENRGVVANVNRLLDAATGKYVAYLDSDDTWHPEKLARQVALMEQHSDAVMSFHDVEYVDSETGQPLGLASQEVGHGPGTLRGGGVERLFDLRIGAHMSSHMYRRDAIGGLRFDDRLESGFDYLFRIELLAKGGTVRPLNDVLGRVGRHTRASSDAASSNRSVSMAESGRSFREMLLVFAIIEGKYPELASPMTRMRRAAYIGDVARSLYSGDAVRARLITRNAIRQGAGLKVALAYWLFRLGRPVRDRINTAHPVVRSIAKRLYRG